MRAKKKKKEKKRKNIKVIFRINIPPADTIYDPIQPMQGGIFSLSGQPHIKSHSEEELKALGETKEAIEY